MNDSVQLQDMTDVFEQVKARLGTKLRQNSNYSDASIQGLLGKIDQVAGHDVFKGRGAAEIATGIEHAIHNANPHANVVSLRAKGGEQILFGLDSIQPEQLTNITVTSHAQQVGKKPTRNIVEEMQKRNKEQALKKKKPYTKGPDLTVEQNVNFKGLEKPMTSVAFGLTAIMAGYSIMQGVKTALEKGTTKREDGTTQVNTGMMALAAAETLFGVGLAAVSQRLYHGMSR